MSQQLWPGSTTSCVIMADAVGHTLTIKQVSYLSRRGLVNGGVARSIRGPACTPRPAPSEGIVVAWGRFRSFGATG